MLLAIVLLLTVFVFLGNNSTLKAASECSIIGNNSAAPSVKKSGEEYSQTLAQEAEYTLILLRRDGLNKEIVSSAIKDGNNVIVRLGAGEDPVQSSSEASTEADNYIGYLREISTATGNKQFFVTASHNEPNCGESVPFDVEMEFARKMASSGIENITWISGQIDYLCGDFAARGDKSPGEYIKDLAAIPNIEGISLPFYTADAGTSEYMLNLLDTAIGFASGKKIYITESGPYRAGSEVPTRDQFLDYATGVQKLISSGKVEALMLFNAFGGNREDIFTYTTPFWEDPCREAFREQCQDPEEVTNICFEDIVEKDPYYVEPIEGMYDFEKEGYQLNNATNQFEKIYEDLVAQGYQAYCSIPNLSAIASSNTNKLMLEDMMGISGDLQSKESAGNRVTVDIDDYKQFFNYIDAQTPLWRKKGVYVLKDKNSLESFWTHKDEDERIGIISTDFSPAYALTSPEDQCREKKKIIAAVDMKCKTLQNKETCALDISYSPETMRYWELYKAVEETDFDCSLMKESNENLTQIQIDIKNSFMRMPFAMPTAYRYAFAIYSADLREPRVTSEKGFEWTNTTRKPGFDFLRYDASLGTNQRAVPRSEVRILAFLIPDFATNQDNIEFTFTPPTEAYFPNENPADIASFTRTHTPKYAPPDYDWNDAIKVARNALQENYDNPEIMLQENHGGSSKSLQENYDDIWKARKEDKIIPDPFNEGKPLIPFTYSGIDKNLHEFNFNPDDSKTKLIECLYTEDNIPVDAKYYQYACVKPLERALTTFVNRRIENPEDCHQDIIKWEENSQIYDDAGIQRSDAALYHLWNGESVHAQAGVSYSGDEVHMLDNGFYPNDVANVIPSTNDSSGEEQIDDPNKKVFEFRFLSHYSFSSFYDEFDPVFRSDAEPEEDEKNKITINGYLVYPVGYELESAQDTFLKAFLTPEQIKQFETEFIEDERDTWFKMTGIEQSLIEKTVEYPQKFWHRTAESCFESYQSYLNSTTDSPVETYSTYVDKNCKKNPEATIRSEPQTDKEPRILGARFGLITIKLQQTLRKVNTSSWSYITSCLESETPTEDFLTGQCGGDPVADGRIDQDQASKTDEEYMNQELIVGVITDCSDVYRIDSSVGGYSLPPSEYSCTVDDSISGVSDNAVEYIESIHGLSSSDERRWLDPNDRVDCDEGFFSFVGCYFNEEDDGWKPSLISHKVDEQGRFTENGTKTACEYVQDKAAEQNVSPKLALAVWLEESGASAFVTENGGADFGVVSKENSRQLGSIELQLRFFLGTINSNRNIGYPRFLLQYSGEYLYGTDPSLTWRDWEAGDPVLFCRNRDFAGRLKNIYEQIEGF